MKLKRIMVPVTEEEFRDFKVEAIKKGTTPPKLARQRLLPDSSPLPTATPGRKAAL